MMLNHANLQKNVILYNAGGGQTKGVFVEGIVAGRVFQAWWGYDGYEF